MTSAGCDLLELASVGTIVGPMKEEAAVDWYRWTSQTR
jgi:hypothetical protein